MSALDVQIVLFVAQIVVAIIQMIVLFWIWKP